MVQFFETASDELKMSEPDPLCNFFCRIEITQQDVKPDGRQCSEHAHQDNLRPGQVSANHSFKDEHQDEKLRNERKPWGSHLLE
jgi:hypothetical protein